MDLDNADALRWHLSDVGERSTHALDGRADLVFINHESTTTSSWLSIYTAFADIGGSAPLPFSPALDRQTVSLPPGEFPVGYLAKNWLSGDFNGDGMTDFINISHETGHAYAHVLR